MSKLLANHFYFFDYFNRSIQQQYSNRNNKDDLDDRNRTFLSNPFNTIGALFIEFLMGSVCLIYLIRSNYCNQNTWCMFIRFSAPGTEHYFAVNNLITCIQIISYMFCRSRMIQNYQFLLPLNMDRYNHNRYALDFYNLSLYRKFRAKLFLLSKIFLFGAVIIGGFLGTTFQIITRQLYFQYNPFIISIWLCLFLYWIVHTSSNLHRTPFVLLIIAYYNSLRQKMIREKSISIDRNLLRSPTINGFSQFIELNREQIEFEKSFKLYNDQMCRYFSILFAFNNLNIAYFTYILFFSDLSINFVPIYSILFLTQSSILIVSIFIGSRIVTDCNSISKWNIYFLCKRSTTFIRFHRSKNDFIGDLNQKIWKEKLRYTSVAFSSLKKPIGFILINGHLISRRTYIDVG
ncbi:zinc finger protein 570-like [Sarcoptes scabiei]|nr:zinc finger protein 570-like [Sarcoptes scabiei]